MKATASRFPSWRVSPRWVIDRAYEVLSSLEEGQTVSEAKVKTRAKPKEESEQLYFIDEKAEAIKKRLRGADPIP